MTRKANVALSRHERKDRLPYGAQARIAQALGINESLVSRVMNTERTKKRHEAIERAIAEEIGLPVERVFPPRETVAA